MKVIFMEQSFLFTVFWKNEMYIGDISEMMDNLGCITDGNNIVPITAAMGYNVQNDNSTKDINEIIRIELSDKLLYIFAPRVAVVRAWILAYRQIVFILKALHI